MYSYTERPNLEFGLNQTLFCLESIATEIVCSPNVVFLLLDDTLSEVVPRGEIICFWSRGKQWRTATQGLRKAISVEKAPANSTVSPVLGGDFLLYGL